MIQHRYIIIIIILCAAEDAKNNHIDFIDVAARINNKQVALSRRSV